MNYGEFSYNSATGEYTAVNDSDAYNDPWQVTDPTIYISLNDQGDEPGDGETYSRGSSKPLTSLARANGQATVRFNDPLDISGSIPFNGSVSGTIAAGSVFTGRDNNANGIPDLLESCLKKQTCVFRH